MGEKFLWAIIDFFRGIFKADQELAESSRYGDSTVQRAHRRSCAFLCLVLVLIVGVIGLALNWWD